MTEMYSYCYVVERVALRKPDWRELVEKELGAALQKAGVTEFTVHEEHYPEGLELEDGTRLPAGYGVKAYGETDA